MVEDEAKDRLIQNVQKTLQKDPNVSKNKHAAFQNDNIHVNYDPD